ncbi:phosphoglycerate kinase [bacterium]|nr:phosphoglycerate kinase [bacterium]
MYSINELALREKRVFIRVDYNVPMKDGIITDDTRIRLSLPTILHALKNKSRIILASHLGRPSGSRKKEFSLEPVAARLAELLDQEIYFFEDCVGMGVQQLIRDMKPGQILMLENLRFYAEEIENTNSFARDLAKLADIYINDAFAVSHRKNASVYALPRLMETKAMGLLMKNEIEKLSKLFKLTHGDKFFAIIGGAKVSDKIGIIRSLLDSVDALFIGGAMAYTFLEAQGHHMGKSLVERDKLDLARDILKGAKARNVEILLPVDHITAPSIDSFETEIHSTDEFPENGIAFDIGPETLQLYQRKMAEAEFVLWNGPMGVFEKEQFATGSFELAKTVSELSAYTVAGGGDSASLMEKAGVAEKFSHISTGGGASLEFLQLKTLLGLEVL